MDSSILGHLRTQWKGKVLEDGWNERESYLPPKLLLVIQFVGGGNNII